ncbi:hypothetical protein CEXT_190871 [Caerostris extrusa]|uniref:Uncharacterized protein n=1 Tax=Caerostris extrusa TaxID=172846 RepID=A0AAV4Q9F1_CAEEX|nr:hypothetical protein CEXT_190871 [Caerostris extrusa]
MKWGAKNMHFGNRPILLVPAIYPVSETVAAYRESGSCCYSIFRNTTSGSNFFGTHYKDIPTSWMDISTLSVPRLQELIVL